jgi:hypothetical protein
MLLGVNLTSVPFDTLLLTSREENAGLFSRFYHTLPDCFPNRLRFVAIKVGQHNPNNTLVLVAPQKARLLHESAASKRFNF